MRIIIEDRLDYILQARAARQAIANGIKPGEIKVMAFSDGSHYGVKCNKTSVRVYPCQ